ncbi:hypothetical protein BV898_17111 [Hypsibius exemplaris]|uniref:Uncharacterized protein n=1 Tax=Hypsibius exemplaris TaxID=2072580 RepID=A0A9X6NG65_HYPEX|nr:hypothetical protein BV898_17111 [Hypsibius exemplaris]
MDILSFSSAKFPRSQPSFTPNLFDQERCGDYLEHLKDREAQLEKRKKALLYGEEEDKEHHDAGSVNRNDYPPAGEEEESDGDEEMQSTSSASLLDQDASLDAMEDVDVGDEIPYDDSEVEEALDAPAGSHDDMSLSLEDIPVSNFDETEQHVVVEEEEVLEVVWVDHEEVDAVSSLSNP